MTRELVSPGPCALPARWDGRFVLGPLLGRGPSSEVYRATDTLLDRAVTVKVWRTADHTAVITRLRALAALGHPHLAPVYELGTVTDDAGSRACLVGALYGGGSFAARRADGRLGVAAALHAGAAVADVLHRLHAAGLAHGAVSGSNVLFDDDGRPHLADVGVVPGAPADDVAALGALLRDAVAGPTPEDVDDLLAALTDEDPAARPTASDAARRLRRATVALDPPPVLVLPRTRAPRPDSTLLDTAPTPVVPGSRRATVAVGGGLALLTVLASVVLVGALLPRTAATPSVATSAALAADHFGPFSDDAESAAVPDAPPGDPASAPVAADPSPARAERRTGRHTVVLRTVRVAPDEASDGAAPDDAAPDGGSADAPTAASSSDASRAGDRGPAGRSSGAGSGRGTQRTGSSSVVQQGAGG